MLAGGSLFEIIILFNYETWICIWKDKPPCPSLCFNFNKRLVHKANPNLISIKFQTFDPSIFLNLTTNFTGGSGIYILNLPTLVQTFVRVANTLKTMKPFRRYECKSLYLPLDEMLWHQWIEPFVSCQILLIFTWHFAWAYILIAHVLGTFCCRGGSRRKGIFPSELQEVFGFLGICRYEKSLG
jgi:hypothetical protein